MNEWDEALGELDPEQAQVIRNAANRAGLQAHDPAARLIAEMWVAVAALRAECNRLHEELSSLSEGLRGTQRSSKAMLVLLSAHLLLFVGWLLV